MKKLITAGVIVAALTLGGAALPAMGDEVTPVDPPTTDIVTPDEVSTESTVAEKTKEPDVGYRLVLWITDEDGELWPQSYVADEVQPEPDINGLDEYATCGTYQADLYRDDDATASLIAGGYLNGPGDPYESWPGDGYQSSYSKQWTVTEGCEPDYVPPTECEAFTTLPLATEGNPQGWSDLKNGTWSADGIQLTATDTEEAYAYVDLDPGYPLSTLGLDTTFGDGATGSFGVIIHTDKANVHYDADGRYWTLTAGVFPETSPGFYSTYNLDELLQDATVDEVAVWVNPGGSLLLKSQAYNCLIQPFGADAVTPPTTPSTTGQLALTGSGDNLLGFGAAGLMILLGIAGIYARRRALQ